MLFHSLCYGESIDIKSNFLELTIFFNVAQKFRLIIINLKLVIYWFIFKKFKIVSPKFSD